VVLRQVPGARRVRMPGKMVDAQRMTAGGTSPGCLGFALMTRVHRI